MALLQEHEETLLAKAEREMGGRSSTQCLSFEAKADTPHPTPVPPSCSGNSAVITTDANELGADIQGCR
jgi:hypothetical protein